GGAGESGSARPRGEKTDLEEKVKDLESKLGEVQKRLEEGKDEKKPKFDQFAARLDLDHHQKEATREILVRGKGELLDHLLKPLSDGTVMADELADAFFQASRDPKKAEDKMKRVFTKLFTEKVPGEDRTYVEVIGELNGRVAKEMKAVMTEEQQRKYDEWAPDATDIEVSNGPIIRYVMDYAKRKGEETLPGEGD
ncbi:MAG: hypothetical protein ACYTFG_20255, partial [Planctomycetota bacterium]